MEGSKTVGGVVTKNGHLQNEHLNDLSAKRTNDTVRSKVEDLSNGTGYIASSAPMPGVGVEGAHIPLFSEQKQQGIDAGLRAGHTAEDENFKRILTEEAEAAADSIDTSKFDPDSHPGDRELVKKQTKLEGDETEVKEKLAGAETNLVEATKIARNVPAPATMKPISPGWLIIVGGALLAIPLSLTVKEYWRTGDPIADWIWTTAISLTIGVGAALFLFFCASNAMREDGYAKALGWLVAIGLALSFAILRYAMDAPISMVIGLGILELTLALLIEVAAQRHQKSVHQWNVENEAHRKAWLPVDEQKKRVKELKDDLKEIKADLDQVGAQLNHRQAVAGKPEETKKAAVKSRLLGYSIAVAQNKNQSDTRRYQ